MRLALLLAAVLVLPGASWIDPHAKAREASRLYEKGDFEAATQKYNEALTDDPDSYLLQYNRGASLYRENKLEDAVAAFGRAPAADPAEIAYNVGNAKYRLGAAAAEGIRPHARRRPAHRRAVHAGRCVLSPGCPGVLCQLEPRGVGLRSPGHPRQGHGGREHLPAPAVLVPAGRLPVRPRERGSLFRR